MSERVLVTGGAGFIGSHVADAYRARGDDVVVLDDLSSGRREHVPDGAELVVADVGSPEARSLLATGGFTVLNHHAAQMDVRVSVPDPAFDARINVLGLIKLLEGAREGGVERVVFASSGGVVYGEDADPPHGERAPKLPVSPYGVSKLASEYYLAAYRRLYGMKVVALRYANVYGPRQNPHGEAGVVAIFGNRLRRRAALTIFGDGSQTRDYVFVSDVARANLCATAWEPAETMEDVDAVAFNVGTGIETSVTALAEELLAATTVRVPIEHAPARAGELGRSAVDATRAGTEWGWRAEVALGDGLKRTYDWILEQPA